MSSFRGGYGEVKHHRMFSLQNGASGSSPCALDMDLLIYCSRYIIHDEKERNISEITRTFLVGRSSNVPTFPKRMTEISMMRSVGMLVTSSAGSPDNRRCTGKCRWLATVDSCECGSQHADNTGAFALRVLVCCVSTWTSAHLDTLKTSWRNIWARRSRRKTFELRMFINRIGCRPQSDQHLFCFPIARASRASVMEAGHEAVAPGLQAAANWVCLTMQTKWKIETYSFKNTTGWRRR